MPLAMAQQAHRARNARLKCEPVQNDLDSEARGRISAFVNGKLNAIMSKDELTVNDLMKLAMVCHSSVKSRMRSTDSAKEIIIGSIGRTRTAPAKTEKGLAGIAKRLAKEKRMKLIESLQEEG